MQLSPNFSLAEMTASETAPRLGIPNDPSPEQVEVLRRFCAEVMEPIRAHLGPITVTSGYRSPALNLAIGGSPTSAHCRARACDHRPALRGRPLWEVLRDEVSWVAGQDRFAFDQVIYEFGRWVHVGAAADGAAPRRQALMAFAKKGGGTLYLPWDPSRIDPGTGLLRPQGAAPAG